MPEKPLPFVITDRRKFTTEGEPRPDADPSPERTREPEQLIAREPESASPDTPPGSKASLSAVESPRTAAAPNTSEQPTPSDLDLDSDLPPAPTPEQMEQSRVAYAATADRLETAMRAANPGADHAPALTFESLVQSVYMQAIMQLGGGTQEGQQPQVDLLGAKQSIDMLTILSEKTAGNASPAEASMLLNALFELRLAFLEITQALARSAQQRAGGPGVPPPPGARPGPSIVR